MLAALVIVAFQLYVIVSVTQTTNTVAKDSKFKMVLYVVLGFTLIQVVLGTQVRESIDHLVESGLPKVFWLESPTLLFYFHRSFSIVIVLANLYLFLRNRRLQLGVQKTRLGYAYFTSRNTNRSHHELFALSFWQSNSAFGISFNFVWCSVLHFASKYKITQSNS